LNVSTESAHFVLQQTNGKILSRNKVMAKVGGITQKVGPQRRMSGRFQLSNSHLNFRWENALIIIENSKLAEPKSTNETDVHFKNLYSFFDKT